VAAGLFIRGGGREYYRSNAGVEAFMLNVASEASANFPASLCAKTSRAMGTVIGDSASYDYSRCLWQRPVPTLIVRGRFLQTVALRPSFTKEDVALVQARIVASLRDDADQPDTYLQRLQEARRLRWSSLS